MSKKIVIEASEAHKIIAYYLWKNKIKKLPKEKPDLFDLAGIIAGITHEDIISFALDSLYQKSEKLGKRIKTLEDFLSEKTV